MGRAGGPHSFMIAARQVKQPCLELPSHPTPHTHADHTIHQKSSVPNTTGGKVLLALETIHRASVPRGCTVLCPTLHCRVPT
jgi:hypothetical protein